MNGDPQNTAKGLIILRVMKFYPSSILGQLIYCIVFITEAVKGEANDQPIR